VAALHWHSAYAQGRTGRRRGPKEGHVEGARSPSGARGANPTARFDEEKRARARIMLGSSIGQPEWPTSGVWPPAPAGWPGDCALHVACHQGRSQDLDIGGGSSSVQKQYMVSPSNLDVGLKK
jgi:hypothetical protein